MKKYLILPLLALLPVAVFSANVLIVVSPLHSCKRLETVMGTTGETAASLEAAFVARLTADMQHAGHTVTIEKQGNCPFCNFSTGTVADMPLPARETNLLLRMLKRKAIHRGVNTTGPDAKANLTAALTKYDYVVYLTRFDFRRPFWAGIFQPGTRQLMMDFEIYSGTNQLTKGRSLRQNMVFLKKMNRESLQYLLRAAASHFASAIKEK